MPEYLSPGVYIEELPPGSRPIEGVSTSTTAMLGVTERGPEYPKLVSSWLEYQRWFGSYPPQLDQYFPYAVQGYFDNGGQRLFVGRITPAGSVPAALGVGDLRISAIGGGDWGNFIYVRVSAASARQATVNQDWVRITLLYFSRRHRPPAGDLVDPLSTVPADLTNPARRDPELIEDFDNLVHTAGAANNVETVINSGSQLVRVWFTAAAPAAIPVADPAVFVPLENGIGAPAVDVSDFAGDRDEAIDSSSPRATELLGRGRGLDAIAAVDEVSLLVVPDEVRDGLRPLTTQLINQCEQLKDRFAVVSADQGQTEVNDLRPPADTSYAAFYYPWIKVYRPHLPARHPSPAERPCRGSIARTDIERGVHKAPANEVVRGCHDLEFRVTKGKQDILNPRGVNCIRDFRPDNRGIRLWGARTMSQRPGVEVRQRPAALHLRRGVDRRGHPVGRLRAERRATWAAVRRSIIELPRPGLAERAP